jgi:hypothetical protein
LCIGLGINVKIGHKEYSLIIEHSARIKGVKINSFSNKNKKMSHKKSNLFIKLFSFIMIIIVGLIAQNFSSSTSPSLIEAVSKPNCKIKGNISKNRSKKYYHIQGMEDYDNTVTRYLLG